jgi:hypothetical protein
MIAQKEDDAVGYKRPPKAYRWKRANTEIRAVGASAH